ncbi:UDP-N-acetylmuramoyl-L-alanyl-D-glutamate--2,6-diaminopimelate ligase [Rhodococcus sp. HNM0569]|uniref:Mur ligase family protein n=1 Tax=Rhodococcus sp. HNM0569 TaxID=2716340 RepID=UPI001469F2CA|nr:UDP-N-acetylmuramoyl-L-alanyl-D-glutamate--2,6-diaminopimelate ligase [Rhodococcus sp. HNM0569]NLU84145.1 UDP-N-acetylmuramoyl-L-alanyl-D-glutamate--2,6-diaminopimelate ligase [Rhodococcus sp. HNM0569]
MQARTIADLAAFLRAPVVGGSQNAIDRSDGALHDLALHDLALHDLVDDSRTVSPGDAYLAVAGAHRHGLDFEDDVVDAGAVAAVSDRPARHLPTVVVEDARRIAGPLASWFHGEPSRQLQVFGVTGTNGKTSTTHFLHTALDAQAPAGLASGAAVTGEPVRPERTTPEATVLQRTLRRFLDDGRTAAALEVSSHALVQQRVDGVHFRVAAFTNLSRDHLDFHHTMDAYFRAKASLFVPERTDLAVVGVTDRYGRRLAAQTRVPTWTCSPTDRSADVCATDLEAGPHGAYRFTARTPAGDAPVRLRLSGPHQVPNALVALAAAVAAGRDVVAAADAISRLPGVPGRCEPVYCGQPFTALVDYMHNAAGARAMLPYLRERTPGRLIMVTGTTGERDRGKRRPFGRLAGRYADLVIVTDENPYGEDPATLRADMLAGVHSAAHAVVVEEPDRRTAMRLATSLADAGDTVVVTGRGSDQWQYFGSRPVRFDDRIELADAIAATRPPDTMSHDVRSSMRRM